MVTTLALSMELLAPRPIAAQGDVLDRIIPSFEVKDMDVADAFKVLFKQVDGKFWKSPIIRGKITLKLGRTKFELVLQNVCSQVHATYRYERKTFVIVKREEGGDLYDDEQKEYFGFSPLNPSARFNLQNTSLFLSPKRTKGGTFDLLKEAIESAGYPDFYVWRYGKAGFAISMPFEAVGQRGEILTGIDHGEHIRRFLIDPSYLPEFGMNKVSELFSTAWDNLDRDYRMIAIAVSTAKLDSTELPARKELTRMYGDAGLSPATRSDVWTKTPTVTAFIYEFRRPPGQ